MALANTKKSGSTFLDAFTRSVLRIRPLSKIHPVYFESCYYLAAAKGGEKPCRLLADCVGQNERAAVAQLVSRGKEQLVLIRPYGNGLIMHGLYYANEVRDFGQIPKGEN